MQAQRLHRTLFRALAGFVLLAGLVFSVRPARAGGSWYVAPTGNNYNSCASPASPCATIDEVLTRVAFTSGDTINVAAGSYTSEGE